MTITQKHLSIAAGVVVVLVGLRYLSRTGGVWVNPLRGIFPGRGQFPTLPEPEPTYGPEANAPSKGLASRVEDMADMFQAQMAAGYAPTIGSAN